MKIQKCSSDFLRDDIYLIFSLLLSSSQSCSYPLFCLSPSLFDKSIMRMQLTGVGDRHMDNLMLMPDGKQRDR